MQAPTPLDVWPDNIREGSANCAAASILIQDAKKLRQKDELVIEECKAYDAWLTLVAEGKRRASNAVDATPTVDESGAYAVTDEKRGW